jgi:hypothetical protein
VWLVVGMSLAALHLNSGKEVKVYRERERDRRERREEGGERGRRKTLCNLWWSIHTNLGGGEGTAKEREEEERREGIQKREKWVSLSSNFDR